MSSNYIHDKIVVKHKVFDISENFLSFESL